VTRIKKRRITQRFSGRAIGGRKNPRGIVLARGRRDIGPVYLFDDGPVALTAPIVERLRRWLQKTSM
jgi:hypothetical protein